MVAGSSGNSTGATGGSGGKKSRYRGGGTKVARARFGTIGQNGSILGVFDPFLVAFEQVCLYTRVSGQI